MPITYLHVAPVGDDSAGDGSEASPYATINRAVSQAATYSNHVDVLVAAGSYDVSNGSVTLQNASVGIWGGYNGGNWTERDPALFPTIISGSPNNQSFSYSIGNFVSISIFIDSSARDATVDGFVIEPAVTGGVECIDALGSPTISHNVCVVPQTGASYAWGIGATGPGAATITDNRIQSPQVGIGTRSSSGLVARNFVQIVNAPFSQWTVFGVIAVDSNGLIVDSNVIDTGNSMGFLGGNGGIAFSTTQPGTATVTSNTVRVGVGADWPNPGFGIGDVVSSTGAISYSMMNNIVWGTPDSGSSKTFCVVLATGSAFSASPGRGLDNNDLFGCDDGLVTYLASQASSGTAAVSASDVNGLSNASANLSFTLTGSGYFVDDNSNWRLEPGATGFPANFLTVKHGGLVLSDSGAADADGKSRPAGFTGATGWSMGAYQQSY